MAGSALGLQCQVWSLERYARLGGASTNTGTGSNEWEYFDNKSSQLELTLVSTDQLLIHNGRKQLESIQLSDAGASMKGINKGDSLMIIWKINDQSRRFRMKFSAARDLNGEVRCKQCVDILVKYFPVKLAGQLASGQEQSQVSNTPGDTPKSGQTLVGDVTLGQLAEMEEDPRHPTVHKGSIKHPGRTIDLLQVSREIKKGCSFAMTNKVSMKSGATSLPSVYNRLSSYPGVDLNTMIKLCLTDPTFPAFVGQVETELEKIRCDNSQ